MKTIRRLLLLAFTLMLMVSCSDDCTLTLDPEDTTDYARYITDPVLLQYCLDYFDVDNDGRLSGTEISMATHVELGMTEVVSLAGLEYFTNLRVLDISYTQVNSISVSDYPRLEKLICSYSAISIIDIQGHSSLSYLECWGFFEELTVDDCPALTYLDCSYADLTKLEISNCPALATLKCQFGFGYLPRIDLSDCPALTYLDCSYMELETLDLSHVPFLTELTCVGNQLESLDLSQCPDLQWVDCASNDLKELIIGELPLLNSLYFSDNDISSIDFSGCPLLSFIDCFLTPMTEIDISNIEPEYLISVYCGGHNDPFTVWTSTSQELGYHDEKPSVYISVYEEYDDNTVWHAVTEKYTEVFGVTVKDKVH